jgi:hypothetical protein
MPRVYKKKNSFCASYEAIANNNDFSNILLLLLFFCNEFCGTRFALHYLLDQISKKMCSIMPVCAPFHRHSTNGWVFESNAQKFGGLSSDKNTFLGSFFNIFHTFQ